jgi:hypothetical protein
MPLPDVLIRQHGLIGRQAFLAGPVGVHHPQIEITFRAEPVEGDFIDFFAPGQMAAIIRNDSNPGNIFRRRSPCFWRMLSGRTRTGGYQNKKTKTDPILKPFIHHSASASRFVRLHFMKN